MLNGQTLKSATSDYDERHVIAFRPITVAARSWSYDKCKCYMLMIFSVSIYVIIYVVKMSDDEAVDIAVVVANASRIYFWGNCRNLENLIKLLLLWQFQWI